MNASSKSADITDKSIDFSLSACNESSLALNKNVGISHLHLSDATRNDSSVHSNGSKFNSGDHSLSITLDADEKQLLRKEPKGQNQTLSESHTVSDENESAVVDELTAEVGDVVEQCSELLENEIAEDEVAETHLMDTYVAEEMETLLENERHYFQQSCVEVGRRLWSSNVQAQHYTKGCMWSPDGTCALVPVHLEGMHVIELPTDLYQNDGVELTRPVSTLNSAVHVKEGGTVYDYAWYPFMNSAAPETCCWLATRQHEPIHMWDAFNGELRCTYRGYDDVDEVESAISVTFSNNGEQVIGGYKKSIKTFDTNIPGRDCNSINVKQALSCLALNTSNDDTVTAGSWNGCINHYDLRVPKLGSLFTLCGHTGGITWLRYAPSGEDSWMLFSGARKDNKILQWDMRNYTQPVREFQRNVDTNQRIYFDLSPQCEWLVSGDTKGLLRVWDLCDERESIELPIHQDCCNGASFHPTRPILATTAGQFHFLNDSDEDEEQENMKMQNSLKQPEETSAAKEKLVDYENSLVFLWFGKNDPAMETNAENF